MRELNDKVAVVTGAASGIGRSLVDQFLSAGMKVALADVESDALNRSQAELREFEGRTIFVKTDVSDATAVDVLAATTIEAFGAVHVLCNNAGVSAFGRSWKFDLDEWSWVLGVNLWGVIHGIRSFMPFFLDQGKGHIVNTASMVGVTSFGGLAPYSVSKHGVVALSEALDLELQELGVDIGVSVLCPGFVRTRIGDSERNRPNIGERKSRIDGTVTELLDVGCSPESVAHLVLEAIREEQFWVFTHPEMLAAVQGRLSGMLEGYRPSQFDLTQLLSRDG